MTAATDRTKERTEGAQRSIRSLLTDSAYATIGAGGAAIEFVRSIEAPKQARNLGKDAPTRLRQIREQGLKNARGALDSGVTGARTLREQGVTGARDLRVQASREFDGLAERGRGLVGAIRDSAAVKQATGQARTARSRVSSAGTSSRRAAADTAAAVDQAGTIVAGRTEPRAKRTGTSTSTSTGARRGGAIRPYEERSILELRDRAKELGIDGYSTMSKDELIAALRRQR